MSAPEASIHDYSSGVPRRHHSFYIKDGNLVFQVENAIFKVHRYFLAKYSSVLRDMLDPPQDPNKREGTDEEPLILNGGSSEGWQLLLEEIYARQPFKKSQPHSSEGMVAILSVAHKYCMESIEEAIIESLKEAIIESLKEATTTENYIDLMVASRIVDSDELYKQALEGLIKSEPKPTLVQARKIGLDAYHYLIAAGASSTPANPNPPSLLLCLHCQQQTVPYCGDCGIVY